MPLIIKRRYPVLLFFFKNPSSHAREKSLPKSPEVVSVQLCRPSSAAPSSHAPKPSHSLMLLYPPALTILIFRHSATLPANL